MTLIGRLPKHYNYFRDYNPETGRYIESDPIGLRGGLNTYGYVGALPLNSSDAFGLLSWGANANTQAQVSIMAVALGGSAAIGQSISTNGKTCTYVRFCMRFGGGAYIGAGIGAGGGLGGTASDPNWSVGVGGDVGAGLAAGGQVTVGPSGISASGGRASLGVGLGFSVGIDLCYDIPIKCKQLFCP